jgi:hypothetical protein
MALNGPSVLLGDAADDLEWARKYYWEVPPMCLNGPENTTERFYDGLERAQCSPG